MRGMKEEERGRKMDRESDDFKESGEERGERVMVSFLLTIMKQTSKIKEYIYRNLIIVVILFSFFELFQQNGGFIMCVLLKIITYKIRKNCLS